MARIKTYKLDDNVTGSDMWIGTDGNDASKTKNFSPTYLANYLNQNEVIDVSNSIRFTYDTIDSGKSRKSGTLSFATEIGAIVPINSLTTFILSKNTESDKLVNAFLNILPGTKIILQKSDYINIFGIFKVISVTQITLEPDFYTVVVEYISGYGSLEEDKDYIISLIDLQGTGDGVPTKTSDLTNDGEDGVNPFITLEDLPPSASTLTEVLFNGNETLGYNIKVNDSDAIELENGSLLKKGSYSFGGFGDIIVSGITNDGDGYINGVMGWGNPSGTQWSDLNGNYAKTSVAVTPSAFGGGDIGMHTPEPGTFNYYLDLISNPTFNGIAYFLAPGNKSGWGDPDNDATTDTPVNYWRLCVLSDYPYVYFTNPSSDPYNFPTSGWVPIDDTIPDSEGGNGYDYIADYGGGFTASISYVLNGNGGISRICSVGYEDMWQAGVRYVFGNSGTIRHATNGFTVIPDSSFDYTKRFAIGSLWTLDNGDTYECTNADLNAAVWELVNTGTTPTLQQVTNKGNTIASGNYETMVTSNLVEVFNVITNTGSSITPDDGISIKTGIYKSNVKTDDLTVDRIHQLPDADGTLALTTDVTNILIDTITDGDTTHAPDGNSVFDALATKEPTIIAGTTSQYWRGDKTWQTLPSSSSGGSSISYYLNGGTAASVATYYQMSKIPVIGTGVDFSLAGNGLISQWLTDVADPNRLEIPAGNWNFEMYFSASSAGGTPAFYVELLKYDGSTFTTIANSSAVPEAITGGTSIDLYLTSLAIPQTTLLVTDRLAIRVYIVNSTGGRTITMHTQDSHLCQIITNFAGGVTSLNGLTANTQYLAVGTTGTDFNISSLTDTHTFNLPDASATSRGALSSTDWTNFNTAYTDRLKWDGGATGLVAATGRTSLGANTVGSNLFTLANPSAITFIQINADNSISTLSDSAFRTAIGAGTVIGGGLINQLAYFPSSGTNIASLDTTTYPSVSEIAYVKGVTSPIQTQIDAVNVNVITITTSISITTDTVSGAYGQHGRHNKISNGANAINIQCVSTSNADFVASYEKIGTATITFTAGAGITLTTLSGTAAMTGVAGSKACLSRNGSIYYLQITNY